MGTALICAVFYITIFGNIIIMLESNKIEK
jgi:hypothetical protein